MAATKGSPTLVDAVQAVFEALEPFDEGARHRILASVVSLLGGTLSQTGTSSANSATVLPAPLAASSIRSTSERPQSPVELLQEKAPATNPQRIAVFAYYRERSEGISRFAKDDLKPYFAKAKLPPPQNFDRDYRQTVKMGWIYDDGADSYLTSKGLESVEGGFGGKAMPRGAHVAKKNRSQKKRSSKGRKR